jgi:chromosome segregation ATPase
VDNFVDLRLNQRGGQAEESFWPSFTDIMTVIVMIFLLAMVILLIRNMELLNQLRATMAAEQQAVELARTTGEEKETLEEKLIAREHEITMLSMQLMRMEEESEQQEAAIASQRNQIGQLTQERNRLSSDKLQLTLQRNNLNLRLESLKEDSRRLESQVTLANQNIESLTEDMARLRRSREDSLNNLEQLRIQFRDKESELAAALALTQTQEQTLSELRTDFSSLKIKYDKLVKPARSARGKTLVEVRYYKRKGVYKIDYKGPGSPSFRSVSRKRLTSYLERLKQEEPDGLYIKVILPKDNGLSYSEAWSFTNELHKKYDYYFQEKAQKERVIKE